MKLSHSYEINSWAITVWIKRISALTVRGFHIEYANQRAKRRVYGTVDCEGSVDISFGRGNFTGRRGSTGSTGCCSSKYCGGVGCGSAGVCLLCWIPGWTWRCPCGWCGSWPEL